MDIKLLEIFRVNHIFKHPLTQCSVLSFKYFLIFSAPQGIFAAPPTSSETASSVVNGNLQQDIADSLPSITSRVRRSIDDEYAIEDEWTINRYIGRRCVSPLALIMAQQLH